jgi:thiol:disulfide interchange protein DsbG
MKYRLAVMAALLVAACAQAQQYPAPVQALAARGIHIKGKMQAPPGFQGYAGEYRGRAMPVYLLPDGKHVLIGTVFDSQGNELTSAALREATTPKLNAATWRALGQAAWIAEGARKPQRVVYVFTDSECPYCHELWQKTQKYLGDGKLQVRHIIVAVIAPSSAGRGAAILGAKDPVAALRAHELAFGHSPIKVLATVPPALHEKLAGNERLMDSLGLSATPVIVYRNKEGQVKLVDGLPPQDRLDAIFGG